ncbi:MAG: chromosome segregation protein SMC [Phycisphaerae bacterium]
MFLKRVLLHGFKSFADRTEFDFGAGITSIVGPNGCGKSNVVDAVRWVLGEQSARTLRGERMADVIFSGSRTRKPANAAEVQLCFDNSSNFLASTEPEVVVSRHLFRNGDSIYKLNGNACRLKDIRDLFLDTGVGVDAYSIIEQGRVDALLQASPQERREIFEEAAGVSRYRARRLEAQRKLERTQNNLLRVNDIVDELEKRLRSVKLAAGKARSYQQYDARLRTLKASFSLAEYHEIETARRAAEESIAGLSDLAAARRAELAGVDADSVEMDRRVLQRDEAIRDEESRLARTQSEISALDERIAQGRRRISDLEETRQRQIAGAASSAERAEQVQARVAAENAALESLRDAEQQCAVRRAELEQRRDQARQCVERLRASLAETQNQAFDAARRASQLRSQRASLAQQRERMSLQDAAAIERVARHREKLIECEQTLVGLTERGATIDADVAARTAGAREIEQRLTALEARCGRFDDELADGKQRRSAVQSRLSLLVEMEQRLDGVDEGTRGVLAWRETPEHDGSVIGMVADVLQIDDPRLSLLQSELARIERQILIRDSYAFLAETERRESPDGPVNVLMLDRLSTAPATANYAGAPGFVACVADWVSCDPQYRRVAEHLLGRWIMVDSTERAMALADSAPEGFAFFTREGLVLHSGGRVTVACDKAVSGLISRKAEIRQLRLDLDEIETAIERLVRQRAELERNVADTRLQRTAALDELALRQREHAELRAQLARAEDELARVRREQLSLDAEIATIQGGLAELDDQLRRLDGDCDAADTAEREIGARIEAIRGDLASQDALLAGVSTELTAAMVEVGRTAERRAAGEHAVADLTAQLNQLQNEKLEAEHVAADARERIALAQQELASAQATLAESREQVGLIEQRLLEYRRLRQSLRQRREALGGVSRRLQGEIEEIDGLLRDAELASRESQVRAESLAARIRDELNIDLAAAHREYRHESQDWDAVRVEIEDLKSKIARLGNVNLDAIAELEELTPRYEHLAAQRQDLVTSIERLTALIAELDQESTTRFSASFEQIRGHFQELFRKLFGGGKADVFLENPDQPLETGIEIVARPPGKEPQSLSLLSGGEKTMTAVALVMAVFRSKPSPFALLDEVDAALDEANVGRFNTLLTEFLPATQFIVITHSKKTMRCADVLYGVTMQEPGVSRRVSVRFEDRVDTPIVA